MPNIKGWRTIAFNAVMLIAVLVGLNWSPETVDKYIEAGAIVWGAGNAVLRAVTNTSIFKKE